MVPVTKKVSLGRREPDETEDGSGGYISSDDSHGGDTEDVSDYDGDPKGAPTVCVFTDLTCRKVFQLSGDAALDIYRVCGGKAGKCVRTGHGEKDRAVGLPGVYDTIRTIHKVDGILKTYRTQEDEDKRKANSKSIRDSDLSLLTGSPGFKTTLKQVNDELAAITTVGSGNEWSESEGETEERKMPAKKRATKGGNTKPAPKSQKTRFLKEAADGTFYDPDNETDFPPLPAKIKT
jgi:hypothetical protein